MIRSNPLPALNDVRAVLDYNSETGLFVWRARGFAKFDNKYAGRPALTANSHGYRVGLVLGKRVLAHRLAFLMANGREPVGEVDHINGVRSDNRAVNLREVSASENRRNARLSQRNTSGAIGVIWRADKRCWCAQMTLGNSHRHLGYFDSFDAAVTRRVQAERENGFHPNHGRAM